MDLFCSIIKANAVNEAARNKVRVDNEILREVTEAKMSGIMICNARFVLILHLMIALLLYYSVEVGDRNGREQSSSLFYGRGQVHSPDWRG
jgi:hypothetical protein